MSNQASSHTLDEHVKLLEFVDFADKQDFEDASRGFVAPLADKGVIRNEKGRPVWDMTQFQFILDAEKAPETVNPSLWRQMRLVMQGGLFKVCDGMYQVRNADLSNMTIFEGETGIIVADPLVSAETAQAALELYYQHRPRKPVVAVIYSHSHVDHYGGVRGVVSEEDVRAGKVKIIAPEGFLEAAVSENILAGTVMGRRASYMYGNLLPPSPSGQVGAGLGVTTSSGEVTLIPPTDSITKTGQIMSIDGLDFEFMLAPHTEAPAEMHWYIEQFKAVTAAENCVHTLHNTYSLRGTKIRDPLSWSKYLNETIKMWGDKAEVMYGMHHWPVWGKDRVIRHLKMGRDGYRFINDQTLRLANHGYVPDEIADMLSFPEELEKHWAMRGYYGTLYHNAKATYVLYLGWFDGNPANLHPLSPVPAARKYVEYMGGADAVMQKARNDYDKGEYRWVAEVMNHVVFSDPDNEAARYLAADSLEQMGYQAESGPWRNFYLTGAKELREGVEKLPRPAASNTDAVKAMSLDQLFDYMGMRLNADKAAGKSIVLNLTLTDIQEQYVLELDNCALSHQSGAQDARAGADITLARSVLYAILLGQRTLQEAAASNEAVVKGDQEAFSVLLSMMDTFDPWFNIVTP